MDLSTLSNAWAWIVEHLDTVAGVLAVILPIIGATAWGRKYKAILDLIVHALEMYEAKDGKKAVATYSTELSKGQKKTLETAIERARKKARRLKSRL